MPWACASCGGANPDGMRFCGHCGAAAGATVPSPVSADEVDADVADVAGLIYGDLAARDRGDRAEVVNRPLTDRLADARVDVDERRLVTALFADVSGFTTLAHGLDAEEVVDIVGPIVARLAEIVGRYEGYVGKFAGDAILAFFGAPVSHEDDAVRALLAAHDMQSEMADVLAGLGPKAQRLTLHVGLNTGYVVAGHFGGEVRMEYSVLGDAVNVAQRLEAAAPGGAVYVGHDTYLLAAERFSFEDLGQLTVKGKPDPIHAWRLVLEAGPVTPSASEQPLGARVVGRRNELAELERTLAGGGGVVAVVGEPGVGKSALIRAARHAGSERGQRWIETHCVAYRARPYRPYVELVRILTEASEALEPSVAAARIAGTVERVGAAATVPFVLRLLGLPLPIGVADTTPADPLAFRQALHEAIAEYLAATASTGPLVLGIEDVHWADENTTGLTRFLAARAQTALFSLVITARPEGRAGVVAIAAQANRSALVDLRPLDEGGIRELAADLLGGPTSDSLVRVVAERTSGNPLFSQQLLRSLMDVHAFEEGDDGWSLRPGWNTDTVPAAVEQVLAARIDRLPRRAADVLQVASVLGRDFHPPLLRRLCPGDSMEHDATIRTLVDGGFLHPVTDGGETRLFFHHALLAEVAYGRLVRSRRREIHRRVVGAVVALYGSGDDVVDILARHAQRGEMGAEAVQYLARAADRSAALFANEQAAVNLRQALVIAEADPSEYPSLPGLWLRLARIEEVTGAYESALDLYQRALAATGDVDAAVGLASTLRVLGRLDRSTEVARQALGAGSMLTGAQRASLLLEEGKSLSNAGAVGGAGVALQAALDSVRGTGSSLEGQVLVHLGRREQAGGDLEAALAHVEAARALFGAQGDLPRLVTALRVLGGVMQEIAEDDDRAALGACREVLERALELARRVGNAEEEGASLMNLGRLLMDIGDHDEALRCDRESIAAFEGTGNRLGAIAGYCNVTEKLVAVGRLEEAEDAAREALRRSDALGPSHWAPHALHSLGHVMDVRGDHAGAAPLLERAGDVYMRTGEPQQAKQAYSNASIAWAAAGHADAAARCVQRAAEVARPAPPR